MKQNRMKYNDTYDTSMLISLSLWNRIQRYIRSLDVIFSKLCRNSKELEFTESRYYRINVILLWIVQLWPYDESKLITVNRIFILAVLTSITFFQFTTFLTFQYTTDFFVSVLSYIVISLPTLFYYYYFCINLNKIKEIWRDISEIWNNLRDEEERNIMRWYSCLGELCTIVMMLVTMPAAGIYTGILFLPLMLDIILPLNEARPVKVYALTEYFIDGEKYYYPILCHWLFALYYGGLIIIATSTFMMVYIQHICGLLKVACYRVRQAIDESTNLSKLSKEDCNSARKLRAAVDIHREALKYAEFLTSSFTSLVIFLILMGAASLCLNSFRLLRAIALQNGSDIVPAFFVCSAHFIVLFFSNYYGQKITDHDSNIFKNVYEVRWYAVPADMQKLLLFIMKKTTKTYSFNIGNVLIASIETFNNVSKMCISYFTVIYSLMSW